MKIVARLESLTNEQWDDMIYFSASGCYFFVESAFQGTYEIDFDGIIRELKFSIPDFGEDIRKNCKDILKIAQSIDKKIEAGEPPIKSDLKFLRSGLQQLADDFRFCANKLRKGR